MGLACIDTLFSPVEAEIVRCRLESAGIMAVLFDAGIASLIGPGVSGIRVMVDADDEALARAELARPV
ncbi:putative signal transducing protein [Sandarakinorhabdus sp.]|uniref:putative signal transducing protein n=1 Tax=Sandarakinorhabdus sp. TaxID=1916663 RepID=UPI003F71D38A